MSDIAFDPGGGIMCNQHRRMGATDSEDCTLCAREDTEEKTRSRVLREVRDKISEILGALHESGRDSLTGCHIYELFMPGSPLDPGTEGKP